ncbi:MAG: hypothetical protein IMF07_00755 [Proteobacteria bacterium]|nr:hypothetical protein [Pseudomonadota bacterium]
MKRKLIVITMAVGLMVATVVGATPNGQPFNEIWDEISEIWEAIGNIDTPTLEVTERSDTFECPGGHSCTYFVRCDNDEVLTGGGFQANDPGVGVLDVWASKPDVGENRWRVTTMNMDNSNDMDFIIYAMCTKLSN